jgi:uncharacterized protein YjgD (DUF1641 family)
MSDTNNIQATPAQEVERVLEAARDSITDDMVSRLAENATQAMDLVDRVNRSGVASALPAIAELVNNGDLERLVKIARVYTAGEDAVTDDMVGRLTETVGNGMELLDRVNRSGLDRALPVLARMVENGDIDRLAHYARVLGAAEDAVTDDMVGRFAELAGDAFVVVDRLNRSGVSRLVDILERMNSSGSLDKVADRLPALVDNIELIEKMFGCIGQAVHDVKDQPKPPGGLFSLLAMMRDPENQSFIRFAFALGKRMQESCDMDVSRRS